MIAFRDVSFGYERADPLLSGIDLDVRKGETVALVGPSGCGKSTLLRLAAGLLDPVSGLVERSSDAKTGFVFQAPALLPWATVAANVALPFTLAGKADPGRVQESLEAAGIGDLRGRYPASLSGGQAMRVSIARALVTRPDILLLDEPFAALDEMMRFKLNDLMTYLKVTHQFTSLFVTHSLYEAAYLADRILVMGQGRFVGEVVPGLDPDLPQMEKRASPALMTAVSRLQQILERGAS